MRPGQNRRVRGRNRTNKGPNPLTRSYESNGPDVKIRGTAQHVADKYAQLARDAQASGDPVSAESYLQHAEHYYRLIAAAQEQFRQQYGGQRFDEDGEEGDEEGFGQGPGTAGGDEFGDGQNFPAAGFDVPRNGGGDRNGGDRNGGGDRGPQPRFDRQGQRPQQRFDRGGYDRNGGNQGGGHYDRQGGGERYDRPPQPERYDRQNGERFDRPNGNGERPDRFAGGERPDRQQNGERFDRPNGERPDRQNGERPNGERYERRDRFPPRGEAGAPREAAPREPRGEGRRDRQSGAPYRERGYEGGDDAETAAGDLPAFLTNPVRAAAAGDETGAAVEPARGFEADPAAPEGEVNGGRTRRRRARKADVQEEAGFEAAPGTEATD